MENKVLVAAHPSKIGGGDLSWGCEPIAMKGCRWVERTGDLFKVAFLEEGRVGDRTYERVEWRKERHHGGTMLPATMDPSAARSSTNGAPKQ